MHDTQHNTQQTPKPLSAGKHFWLSFLAVVTGVPVAGVILSGISIFFLVLLGIFMAAAFSGSSTTAPSFTTKFVYGDSASQNTFISVPVRGVILSGTAADPLQAIFGQSFTDGEMLKNQIREIADDNTASGLLLDIDSPGGMITASKAIADGVAYYKEQTGKPVIAHINGTGASGAYWAAVSTDKIFAEQGSEAGSVGVIMGPIASIKGIVGYDSIATTEPMKFQYFTAGRSKDIGNPYRDLTADEQAFIQRQIDSEYTKFVDYVSARRGIPQETLRNDVGALAYGTDEAKAKKLIDDTSTREEAYDKLGELASVGTDFQVQAIDTASGFFSSLFGARSFIGTLRMSSADKSASRQRFCATNLIGKPLVLSGSVEAICK